MSSTDADVLAVEEANRALYAAIENGDLDAMAALWAHDDENGPSVCVHPGWSPVLGRARILRSWALVMAGTPYIQFFLTDVRTHVAGDVAIVSCAENILTAVGDGSDGSGDAAGDGFTGGHVVTTNVFRRTEDGWQAIVHHASPVLSRGGDEPAADEEQS